MGSKKNEQDNGWVLAGCLTVAILLIILCVLLARAIGGWYG